MSKQGAIVININDCKHITIRRTVVRLIVATVHITPKTCIKSKLTDMPYLKLAEHRANRILDFNHSDVSEPMQTLLIGGKSIYKLS